MRGRTSAPTIGQWVYPQKGQVNMADMLFDTQKMVERLESVGVPPVQARMHIAILAEVMSTLETVITERCASKDDIARLEARIDKLQAHIDNIEVRTDAKLSDLKSELIRWVVTVGILQMALIAALVLKLVP
jgi:hypothetical protein